MHTSYKELNHGITRKEGISNHKQKAVTKLQQSTERTRTESWHRVRKEEHEGESKCRVSKAVLAMFGCQQIKIEGMKQCTSFLCRNQRFQKLLLQKY
jgi:hypothetical protein